MLNIMLPRVNEFERSPEWNSLASDINDFERLYSRNPTFLMRTRQYEKRTCHRRSMPEIQKAKLIALNTSPEEDRDSPSTNDGFAQSESNLPYRWSWKPKTEFERTYFYGDYNNDGYSITNTINLEEPMRLVKLQDDRKTQIDRVSYNIEDFQKSANPNEDYKRSYRDHNSNNSRENADFHKSENFVRDYKPSYRDRNLNITRDEPEYSGSRERLHEIFEHNRYLRRQFFGITDTNSSCNDEQRATRHPLNSSTRTFNKNVRSEVFRHAGRFGSTETLTSQSNQSSVSSTNGRKSQTKSNSPELSEESRPTNFSRRNESSERDDKLAANVILKKKVEFVSRNLENDSREETSVRTDRYDGVPNFYDKRVGDSTNQVETDGLKLLNRFESVIENHKTINNLLKNPQLDNATNTRWHETRKPDPHPEDFYQSMPNLSNISNEKLCNIARLSVNGTTVDFGRSMNATVRPVEEDRKYYASCVQLNVPEENRLSRNGSRRIPPPLDLRDVNERYERIEESERKYLKNYTVDVALLRDYDRPIECQLTVLDDSNRVTEESGIIKNNSKKFDKSSNDLSYLNDLRSPQLVNNYKNSMIDLRNGSNTEKDLARSTRVVELDGPENGGTTSPLADRVRPIVVGPHSGTGSTLPSVYGPIPYSQ